MMITLSNGTRLALADDISAEVMQAQIEVAEEEIADKRASQAVRIAEQEIVPRQRGRR